jgi:hypothetical protein
MVFNQRATEPARETASFSTKGRQVMGEIEVSIHTRGVADGGGIGAICQSASIQPDTPQYRAVLDAIRSYPLDRLVDAALSRDGYRNSDGGFGVQYERDPEELEQFGAIPPRCVEVYTFWGPPEGEAYIVPETTYLMILALILKANDRNRDFEKVNTFLTSLA